MEAVEEPLTLLGAMSCVNGQKKPLLQSLQLLARQTDKPSGLAMQVMRSVCRFGMASHPGQFPM